MTVITRQVGNFIADYVNSFNLYMLHLNLLHYKPFWFIESDIFIVQIVCVCGYFRWEDFTDQFNAWNSPKFSLVHAYVPYSWCTLLLRLLFCKKENLLVACMWVYKYAFGWRFLYKGSTPHENKQQTHVQPLSSLNFINLHFFFNPLSSLFASSFWN